MSLINQMLRDLEDRRAAPATAGGGVASLALAAQRAVAAGTSPAGSDGRAGGTQRWLIAVIVLLAVLLGLLLWSSQPPWQERMPAANAGPMLSVPVVEMAVAPVAAVPARPREAVEPMAAAASAAGERAVVEAPPPPAEAPPPVVAEKTVAVSVPRPEPLAPPAPGPRVPVPEPPARPEPVDPPASAVPGPRPPAQSPDTVVNKHIRPLDDEQRAQQALRRGVGLLGGGRRAEAEQALRDALRLDPGLVRARETLAALYFNSGRLSEAQSLLAEGVRLSPNAAGLAQLHARLLAEQGDLATALTVLQRASPPLAKNPDYHALLAALYQRDGQHDSAAWVYRQLLAQDGRRATWWLGLGISLEALDDIAQALEAYLKAHQLGAGLDPQVLSYLGSRIGALAPRVAAMKKAAEAAKREE